MSATAFPIVGIGASAGGLDAFHKFFDHMPADCGMAFVMILHLPADRKSMLPEILARWTPMQVVEGVDGTMIQPNCVYVPPPHAIVSLKDGRLGVRFASDDQRVPRPIDAFFDSLGSSLGEQSVGIVLSGTGSDGALGLKAMSAKTYFWPRYRTNCAIRSRPSAPPPEYSKCPTCHRHNCAAPRRSSRGRSRT